MKADLIMALATTYQLVTGRSPETGLKNALIQELDQYPPEHVLHALNRCKNECKGFLPLAEIIERMPNNRPAPSEAWAMIPKSEDESCIWTDEMREAYGAAHRLLLEGDTIAARRAFIEAYERICGNRAHLKTKVSFSPGRDKNHRVAVLKEAFDRKQITGGQAMKWLPHDSMSDKQTNYFEENIKMLPGKQLRYYKFFEHGKEDFPRQVFSFDFDALNVLKRSCSSDCVTEITKEEYDLYIDKKLEENSKMVRDAISHQAQRLNEKTL